MEKWLKKGVVLVIVLSFMIPTQSCQRKVGCENTEEYQPKTDRNGNLSTKRGDTNLFSKKMQKSMKKR